MTAVSWETELHSLYTAELRAVMSEVRNSLVVDDMLHFPQKLSTFIDRVHDKFNRTVNYKYIRTVCFAAFFEKEYQTYSINIGVGYFSQYVLPFNAVHTTEYVDTVVRFMTNHLETILESHTAVLH